MSELLSRNVLLFAGEMFILSAIILALAWEASHLFRNRAALRHLVWLGAFASLIVLPVLAAVLPSHVHFTLASPSLSQPVVQMQDIGVAPAAAMSAPDALPSMPAATAPQAPAFKLDVGLLARLTALLWLTGVGGIALRGGFALLGLRALKRRSRAHVFDKIDLPEGRYDIRIAREPNNFGPVTWGILRPVVLLPFQAQFWSRERLHAVLMHEVAHIRRRDSLSQLLSMLVCALYWPNPLVWAAARSLRAEAEMAADDSVLASGVRASAYAGELLQLASEYRSREPALAGMPLFMAGSALEARLKSVLASTPQRSGVTKMDVLKIGGVAIAAAAVLTFARPTFAQEETSTPPAPAAVAVAPLPPAAAADTARSVQPAPVASHPHRLHRHATPASPAPVVEAEDTPASPAPVVQAEPTSPAPLAVATPIVGVHPVVNIHTGQIHSIRHIVIDTDGAAPSPEEMARFHAEIARAVAESREMQPRIEEAQRELLRQETKLRELQAHLPEIQARMQAELARIQPEIDQAVAEARLNHLDLKIRANIDDAMKHADVRIETRKAKETAHESEQQDPASPDHN
ncbi:MAG: M56 family metallopeptidase [Rhizomicrobium sp.]